MDGEAHVIERYDSPDNTIHAEYDGNGIIIWIDDGPTAGASNLNKTETMVLGAWLLGVAK